MVGSSVERVKNKLSIYTNPIDCNDTEDHQVMYLYMVIQGLLLSLTFKFKFKSVMYASNAHYRTFCLLLS